MVLPNDYGQKHNDYSRGGDYKKYSPKPAGHSSPDYYRRAPAVANDYYTKPPRPASSYKESPKKEYKNFKPTLYRWDDNKEDKGVSERSEARADSKWYRGDYQDEFRETHDYYTSLDVVDAPDNGKDYLLEYDYFYYEDK